MTVLVIRIVFSRGEVRWNIDRAAADRHVPDAVLRERPFQRIARAGRRGPRCTERPGLICGAGACPQFKKCTVSFCAWSSSHIQASAARHVNEFVLPRIPANLNLLRPQ